MSKGVVRRDANRYFLSFNRPEAGAGTLVSLSGTKWSEEKAKKAKDSHSYLKFFPKGTRFSEKTGKPIKSTGGMFKISRAEIEMDRNEYVYLSKIPYKRIYDMLEAVLAEANKEGAKSNLSELEPSSVDGLRESIKEKADNNEYLDIRAAGNKDLVEEVLIGFGVVFAFILPPGAKDRARDLVKDYAYSYDSSSGKTLEEQLGGELYAQYRQEIEDMAIENDTPPATKIRISDFILISKSLYQTGKLDGANYALVIAVDKNRDKMVKGDDGLYVGSKAGLGVLLSEHLAKISSDYLVRDNVQYKSRIVNLLIDQGRLSLRLENRNPVDKTKNRIDRKLYLDSFTFVGPKGRSITVPAGDIYTRAYKTVRDAVIGADGEPTHIVDLHAPSTIDKLYKALSVNYPPDVKARYEAMARGMIQEEKERAVSAVTNREVDALPDVLFRKGTKKREQKMGAGATVTEGHSKEYLGDEPIDMDDYL